MDEHTKNLKIWLDDSRNAPEGWIHVKTAGACLCTLILLKDRIDALSLDHDLGEETLGSGDDVVLWLAEHPEYFPKKIYVHSANAAGRQNMLRTIGRYHPLGADAQRLASRAPASPLGEDWDTLWREAGAMGEDPK